MEDKTDKVKSNVILCFHSKKTLTVLIVLNIVGWSFFFATRSDFRALVAKVPTIRLSSFRIDRLFSFKTDEADLEWVQQRQKLLSDPSRPTKVLLMTYMRGGSSFLGEIFNKNLDAMYWYEVGAQFYAGHFAFSHYALPMDIGHYSNGTRREVLTEEKRAVSDLFQALYSCELEKVPLVTLAHPFMKASRSTNLKCLSKYTGSANQCGRRLVPLCNNKNNECFHNLTKARQCIRKTGHGKTPTENCTKSISLKPFIDYYKCFEKLKPGIAKCLPGLQSACNKAKIHSSKVHRLTMESLELLIKDMPDIHIVHYTRDPRGILNSRSQIGKKPYHYLYSLAKGNPAKAAKYFCPKMMRDLEIVKRYKTKYPGAIMTLAYEDLAANPGEGLQKVYSFIGEPVPKNVNTSLSQDTHANKSSGSFGTKRKNATETSLKWRERLNTTILEAIDSACSDVYRKLGLVN